jgi:ankyrin repeat protein
MARYAAQHWVTHAQFKNVSSHLQQAMEQLFDWNKPYFEAWLELHDIDSEPSSPLMLYQFAPFSKSPAGPLYYAALCGFQDLVEHLIVKNPQGVNASGGYFVTPGVAALAGRHFQLAQLLHRNGSSISPRGLSGRTPLHSAVHHADLEMIQVLLRLEVDINAQSDYGLTPLRAAFPNTPYLPIIQLLLAHGADPNIPSHDGLTLLYLASTTEWSEVVRLLFEHGADVEGTY